MGRSRRKKRLETVRQLRPLNWEQAERQCSFRLSPGLLLALVPTHDVRIQRCSVPKSKVDLATGTREYMKGVA